MGKIKPKAAAKAKGKMSEQSGNGTGASAQGAHASAPSAAQAGLPAWDKAAEIVRGKALEGRVLRMVENKKITNRFDWNVRSKASVLALDGPGDASDPQDGSRKGLGSFAKEDDEKEGLKKGQPVDGMVRMLADDGQKTPVDLMPDPRREGHFFVIDGATRFEAKKLLDEHKVSVPNVPFGMIEAYVYPHMTEDDAEDWNLARATDHRDLRTADLAFGIARSGKRLSDSAIAAKLGVEQSYVSKLHRIVKNAPGIAKKWREENREIGHKAVAEVVKLPVDQRDAAWEQLLKAKRGAAATGGGEGEGESTDDLWFDKAKEKATAMGTLLGLLDAKGLISAHTLDFDASLPELAPLFRFKLQSKDKKKATKRQHGAIAKEAEEAFATARGKVLRETEATVAAAKAAQAGTAPDIEATPN
jgi:hypothetical protein